MDKEEALNYCTYEFSNGMKVKELKDLIKDWSEIDPDGDSCEVWICNGNGTSRPVKNAGSLNLRKNYNGEFTSDFILG